jgi:hypothetical protein
MATGKKRLSHMKADEAGATSQKNVHDKGFRLAAGREQGVLGGLSPEETAKRSYLTLVRFGPSATPSQ